VAVAAAAGCGVPAAAAAAAPSRGCASWICWNTLLTARAAASCFRACTPAGRQAAQVPQERLLLMRLPRAHALGVDLSNRLRCFMC
jgi:hypothetical protein